MLLSRTTILRGLQRSVRPSIARSALLRASAPSRTQLALRRGYADSHGEGHSAPSSDLPWLVSAIAVTGPSCWYLWPKASHADAHGGHDEHHEEAHEEKEGNEKDDEGSADGGEKPEDDGEQKFADADDAETAEGEGTGDEPSEPPGGPDGGENEKENSDDSAKPLSGSEGESQPQHPGDNKESYKAEDSEPKPQPENMGNTKDVQSKGPVKAEAAENLEDTRKREPDGKGGFKKRIDSSYQKDLGPKGDVDDTGDMAKKQAGLSNTQTRHSMDPVNDLEQSSKGDGSPETAKAVGTVSVDRKAK